MKKSLLLGAAGAVSALVASAPIYTIPVYADDGDNTVNITLFVGAPAPTLSIEAASDQVFNSANIEISIDYTDAEVLDYQLEYLGLENPGLSRAIGTIYQLPSKRVAEEGEVASGTDVVRLNLDDYDGYGFYRLSVTNNGNGVAGDSIIFEYRAPARPPKPNNPGQNDPGNVDPPSIDVDDKAESVIVQIHDKDGNLVGEVEVPVDGPGEVVIDLEEIASQIPGGLPEGDYVITLVPVITDANGDSIRDEGSKVEYEYTYDGLVFVPNTGDVSFFGDLTSSDFTAAFLVLFVAAVLGGLYFMKKSNKSSRHNR